MNTQRDCVTNCALRGLAHRSLSSQVLTIRALYDAFEIVISRIVTFLKSYRNCLVSLDLRSSFEIVTPEQSATPILPGTHFPNISNLFISEGGILQLLKGLDISKASGPNQIPNNILRELASYLLSSSPYIAV